jgi:hypothetical protein
MSEEAELLAVAALAGLMVGMLWGKWLAWGYIRSKTPDGIGFRTAFPLRGKLFYVVTEREYVERVMPPLPGEMRVEQHPGFVRFTNRPEAHASQPDTKYP